MKKQIDIEQKKEQYASFMDACKTLVISSKDGNGDPFISYTPYIQLNGKFYIYISRISDHYRFIESNEFIHIMMIADEKGAQNKFALERVRFQCTTENIGNEGHGEIFARFEKDHGKAMMDLLRGLDFSLFELNPRAGRYVVGFGQAFDVDVTGSTFTHVVVDKKDKQ
ncbi:HugZ family protein [Bacillus sp. 1P06AnD]|uniref:HugZ family pyridoxamine 5'-phosphate oxidase n=1 Tax=Bacillus sp. 1P06AnD TaxID=3132208 RepID=UPI0039A35663